MNITLNCSTVLAALKDVEQNTKSQHCSAKIRDIKGLPCLVFASQGNGVTIERILHDIEVENSDGSFTFNIHVLKGVLNKRKKISLSIDEADSTLRFWEPGGTYEGDTVILPYEDVTFEKNEMQTIQLGKDTHKHLIEALSAIRISDLYGSAGIMSGLVSIRQDGIRVATYDQFHMACAKLDEPQPIKTDVHFVLPLSVFDCLNALAEGEDYALSITEASIFATNRRTFRISMPLLQASLPMRMQQVINLIKAVPTDPEIKFTVNREDIDTALANTSALAEPNSCVTLEYGAKNKIKLSIKTNYGNITESLAATDFVWKNKATKVQVDPTVLTDVLSVISDPSITILGTSKFICLPVTSTGKTLYYFSSLL